MALIGHRGNTFFVDMDDAGEGWLGPIEDADEGEPPLRLIEMLLLAPPPTLEPLALLADFLDRHYFAKKERGRPKAGDVKPWTSAQMRRLARDLMVNRAHLPPHPQKPAAWRVDLAEQLLSFRLANARTNRRPQVYMRTDLDARLLCAAAEARTVMREQHWNLKRAAELIAPRHYLSASTLINDMTGHRGSRRHARDGAKPLKRKATRT
jgi:hypothetical protein